MTGTVERLEGDVLLFRTMAIIFLIVLVFSWILFAVLPGDEPEIIVQATEEKEVSYVHYMNALIIPEHVKGFSIQKYAVASLSGPQFEYIVLVHGVDNYNLPGFRFDSMDKAERVMIWLAGECGL